MSPAAVAVLSQVLPGPVLREIVTRTGPLTAVDLRGGGRNNDLAAVATLTHGQRVFIKALHSDHPCRTQAREAAVAPHVEAHAPRLLWSVTGGGWHVNAFEALDSRAADFTPDSPDLPAVVELLTAMSHRSVPVGLDLPDMSHRMRDYVDGSSCLAGTSLLHTDWNPSNVQVTVHGVRLVDWAWASTGQAWIDTACWCVWLVASGHAPAQAEAWAARVPVFADVPCAHLDVFTDATAAVWAQAATVRATDWHHRLAEASAAWAAHRSH